MSYAPVSSEERIHLVDALRGFALCGILVHNILGISGFFLSSDAFPDITSRFGPGTEILASLTGLLVSGKFIAIFSFLFGLGFSIQLLRGQSREGWLKIYLRRVGILFLFGVAHAFFLWFGDILWVYAVLGLVLLLFRNSTPTKILIWAVVI